MTATYLGSGEWNLQFDNKTIQLSEQQMEEIVEQYEDMVYRECHDDIHEETEHGRKLKEAIKRNLIG